MLRKFFYFMMAAYIAWYAGPYLTKLFWFLPIKDIAIALTPVTILSRGFSFYTSFLLWTIVVWMILQATGITVAIAESQNYGETKPARFIKGALGELLAFSIIAAPVFWVLLTCGGKSTVLAGMAQGMARRALSDDLAALGIYTSVPNMEARWNEETIWGQAYLTVRYLWWMAAPFALPLYFFLHRRVKRAIGRIVAPLLRLRDRGRGGRGGAARFAGIFEEWELLTH